jgi:hypothetical protein
MFTTFKLNSNYRLLDVSGLSPAASRFEVRKYNPVRRSITNSRGDTFLLPMPYQIYITHEYTQSLGGYKTFYASFALENDDIVYGSPFYSPKSIICVDNEYHCSFPNSMDMGEIIQRYWSTSFGYLYFAPYSFNSLKGWSLLSTEQVMAGMREKLAFVREMNPNWVMSLSYCLQMINSPLDIFRSL